MFQLLDKPQATRNSNSLCIRLGRIAEWDLRCSRRRAVTTSAETLPSSFGSCHFNLNLQPSAHTCSSSMNDLNDVAVQISFLQFLDAFWKQPPEDSPKYRRKSRQCASRSFYKAVASLREGKGSYANRMVNSTHLRTTMHTADHTSP